MKANNSFERSLEFVSNPGSQYKITYRPIVQNDGDIVLEPDGKIDMQQQIDSWRDQTDMAYVLQRMVAGQYQGRTDYMYGDFTQMPDNMAGMLQLKIDAERAFYDLPLDVRKKFDMDPTKWLIELNTDTKAVMEKMGMIDQDLVDQPVIDPIKKEEVSDVS